MRELQAPVRPGESVAGASCRLVRLSETHQPRGRLAAVELGDDLPFTPRRAFMVYDVPRSSQRGCHAHLELEELLIAVGGQVTIELDDGNERALVVLDQPTLALHIRPRIWAVQRDFHAGTTLIVLASHAYDPDDYVNDYDEFLALVHGA